MVARGQGRRSSKGGSKSVRTGRTAKPKRPSRTRRRVTKKGAFFGRRALLWVGLVLLICGGTVLLWGWPRFQEHLSLPKSSVLPKPRPSIPLSPQSRGKEGRDVPVPPRPRVAILIDDLGWNSQVARSLLDIDAPLSFAVLPYLPHSKSIAHWAREKHRDVLLHLPLEPHGYPQIDPGKGALLKGMSEDRLEERLSHDLEAIPYAVGVNNHMGSRFTEDERAMRVVLRVLKKRGLFFLDSRTSSRSVGYDLARELGLKTGRRWVFLDHPDGEKGADAASIEGQLWKLSKLAKREGQAIAIGHPHASTIEALRHTLPRLIAEGVEVVPVSALMH